MAVSKASELVGEMPQSVSQYCRTLNPVKLLPSVHVGGAFRIKLVKMTLQQDYFCVRDTAALSIDKSAIDGLPPNSTKGPRQHASSLGNNQKQEKPNRRSNQPCAMHGGHLVERLG